MDIFEKCYGYTEAKEAIKSGLYPYFIPMTKSEGSEAVFQGKRLIMCGSNNYLGLTADPRVRQAAIDAVKEFGTSCTGSRFLNGTWNFTNNWSANWPNGLVKKPPWFFPPACRPTWV
jgi:7-keto-8-aminopelargonate synthetase-like enzyme